MFPIPDKIQDSVCSFLKTSEVISFQIAFKNVTTHRGQLPTTKYPKNKYLLESGEVGLVYSDEYYRYHEITNMKHFRREIARISANVYCEVNSLKFNELPQWSDSQRVQYFHQKEIFRIKVLKAAEEMTTGFLMSKDFCKNSNDINK